MNMSKLDTSDYMKIAGIGMGVYSVLSTIRSARRDDDGLQLLEGVLRGAAMALSIAIIVRNLRHLDDEQALEA